MLAIPHLDAVVVSTSWETHIPIAIDAMKAGVRPGVEVGAAYSLDQLWQLVRTSEETGVPCMLLENCCYGRDEMMIMNMVRQGISALLFTVRADTVTICATKSAMAAKTVIIGMPITNTATRKIIQRMSWAPSLRF